MNGIIRNTLLSVALLATMTHADSATAGPRGFFLGLEGGAHGSLLNFYTESWDTKTPSYGYQARLHLGGTPVERTVVYSGLGYAFSEYHHADITWRFSDNLLENGLAGENAGHDIAVNVVTIPLGVIRYLRGSPWYFGLEQSFSVLIVRTSNTYRTVRNMFAQPTVGTFRLKFGREWHLAGWCHAGSELYFDELMSLNNKLSYCDNYVTTLGLNVLLSFHADR
jgi:hypothetical protein